MSNVKYIISDDGKVAKGVLENGTAFFIDACMLPRIEKVNFYRNRNTADDRKTYITGKAEQYSEKT